MLLSGVFARSLGDSWLVQWFVRSAGTDFKDPSGHVANELYKDDETASKWLKQGPWNFDGDVVF